MPRKSAEQIRSALKADPNTAKLAAQLGMPLEDYMKLVVHFATTGAEPQLFVVPDAELEKRGHTPPDLKQMNTFLSEAVAVKMTVESTGYTAAKAKPMSLGAQGNSAQALPADPALAAEIKKRRKS